MTDRQTRFLKGTLLLTALALLLRIFRLGDALEYDEIWTLEYYASASLKTIFTDLSLPNNHPLNSLAVRLTAFPGAISQWIRLVPLAAGVLAIPLAGITALGLWRRRNTALWCMFFFAALPLAVFYSQQARGYSLQLFFLLLFCAGLFLARRMPVIGCAGILLGAAGAMLTLPTSAFYLAAIGTYAVFRCRKEWRGRLPAAISLAAAGGLSLLWILVNFKQLEANRGWGIPIDSLSAFGTFLQELISRNFPMIVLFAAAPVLLLQFRRSLPILWVWVCLLAAAFFFNAGPSRTYLPLAAATVFLSGAGAALLCRRFPTRRKLIAVLIVTLTLAALFSTYRQPYPDWYAIHRMIRELPPEVLVLFPANDTYPLARNNAPESYREQLRRIAPLPPKHARRKLLVIGRNGELTGSTPAGAERPVSIPVEGVPVGFDALQGMLYGLEELDGPPAEKDTVIAVIRPLPEEEAKRMLQKLFSQPDFLTFNIWLCTTATENGTVYRYFLAGGNVTQPGVTDWSGFLRGKPGATALYRIISPGKSR